MFFKQSATVKGEVSTSRALRHLLVFQFKLAMDALRDFALSPISILVFLIDAIRKPPIQDSLYLRLMSLGRRSDQVINLFDEYSDSGEYTVDETLAEVEQALWGELEKKRKPLDKGGE